MATNPFDKVYLTEAQLNTLAGGGSITSGSDTYIADEDTMYLTDNTDLKSGDNISELVNNVGYVTNTDYASSSVGGVVKVQSASGLSVASGVLKTYKAENTDIDAKTQQYRPIVPDNLDYAIKVGITTNTNTLNSTEQANAKSWLGIKLYLHCISIVTTAYRIFLKVLNNSDTQFTNTTFKQWLYDNNFRGTATTDTNYYAISGGNRTTAASLICLSCPNTSGDYYGIYSISGGTTATNISGLDSFSDNVLEII